jgi:DNA anti-recombination protein RmuC
MEDSKTEYDNAMNKLVEGKGNLITSVERLKKMGAKAKKSLPEVKLEYKERLKTLPWWGDTHYFIIKVTPEQSPYFNSK